MSINLDSVVGAQGLPPIWIYAIDKHRNSMRAEPQRRRLPSSCATPPTSSVCKASAMTRQPSRRCVQAPYTVRTRITSFTQQAVRRQLSATISNQVESIGGGLELLNRAQKAIVRVQQAFAHINRLCAECNNVIQHNDKIQALASVHYHISKTLQYAAHVRELPDQAREAEVLLNDDAQLLQVYEMLSILECTSIKTKMALEAGAKASVSQSSTLNEYFAKVTQWRR